ncbi:peptidoglycan DD-metalloendopeptidase family protein [Pontibacter sp. JAM-7]|uniref:peptidoglycan DD-metalloendopeptidase family protein n=1 Tax=Pontibacter sp. JAM-7 TaxID=3366581 RepID=UPI003AF9CF91
MGRAWIALLGLMILLLQGCGSSTYVPVSDKSKVTAPQPAPSTYVVQRGDTLYAIAFKYGLDFKDLARMNNINGSQIYPGQKLKLKAGRSPNRTGGSIVRDASVTQTTPVINPPKTATVTKKTSSAKPSTQRSRPATKTPTSHVSTGPVRWQWPAPGSVVQHFSTSGKVNKGINLAGKRGDPVFAAASGRVVYAGNGLLGYGNLVIVDHNQQYLSAYAHNSRIMVQENDTVKAGQKIAEFGNTGTDRVMLHFEIRRDGQPLNPLKFLPKR